LAGFQVSTVGRIWTSAEGLGHSSTKMTLDVYSHVLEPVERDATERIEEAVFGR
jgi:integrase